MPDFDNRIAFVASIIVDVSDLTPEQRARLHHHAEISRRVFQASIASMVKGVRKYPPEPGGMLPIGSCPGNPKIKQITGHWLPHIFSEAVDCANQTGLFADALGVEICQPE